MGGKFAGVLDGSALGCGFWGSGGRGRHGNGGAIGEDGDAGAGELRGQVVVQPHLVLEETRRGEGRRGPNHSGGAGIIRSNDS